MERTTSGVHERFRAAFWQAVRGSDTVRLRQWEQWHITLPQLRVLHQIRRTPEITTGELAAILGITVSTTSGLVGKLADRGLVERLSAPGNRRQIPLRLTAQGESLLGEMRGPARLFLDEVIRHLGDDLPVVTEALERLAQAEAEVREQLAPVEATVTAEADA